MYDEIEIFVLYGGDKGDNALVVRKKIRSKSCCHWSIHSTKVELTKQSKILVCYLFVEPSASALRNGFNTTI